jgi:hypothetical protein
MNHHSCIMIVMMMHDDDDAESRSGIVDTGSGTNCSYMNQP